MKRFPLTCLIILSLVLQSAFADILAFAPCDEAALNSFGDVITLSQDDGTLRRYVKGKLMNAFYSQSYGAKIGLREPLRPVLDEPDIIYLLDAANNTVISWDRFLNIHSITPLNEDILSPQAFTVTSEHDWLIYDSFYDHIIQIQPGENYAIEWGDKNISGDIDLYSVDQHVLIFLKDKQQLRYCDEKGRTLVEYDLPDTLNIKKIFPLDSESVGLSNDSTLYIWKPQSNLIRYRTDLEHVIFMGHLQDNQYLLITQDGDVFTIP